MNRGISFAIRATVNPPLRVAAFPRDVSPYTACLYRELARQGIDVVEGDLSIRWLLREVGRIDWFHFHWPSLAYAYRRSLVTTIRHALRFILFLTIIRVKGRRVAWTAHNLYPHDTAPGVYGVIDRIARRIVVAIASTIFVHGRTAMRIVEQEFRGASGKLVTIDHGHWVGYYANDISKADARQSLGVAPDAYVFLFVGLCKRYKDLPALIAAFRELPGNARLVIAGRFQEPEYEREIAKRARADRRIRLVPWHVPDHALQVFLNASDAVVLPYTEILTSGAALLAISFGRPVVAPAAGYLRDVVTDSCGVLYEPRTPDALPAALAAIRERAFDEERIIARARTFDWERIAQITAQALRANRRALHEVHAPAREIQQ